MSFELDPARPPNEDNYYLGVALAVRRKANCTGNRVAAVVVKNKRVIATGYNGVPEGMANCLDGGCLRCSNPGGQFKSGTRYDLCICVHAEQNALLSAARFGIAVEGSHLYTTMQPCFGCAKELLQAKVARVYYMHPWIPSDVDPELDAKMKDEYEKILSKLDIRRLKFDDPVASWAVTALRHDATAVPDRLPPGSKKVSREKPRKSLA
jgi:dCMP deaminase